MENYKNNILDNIELIIENVHIRFEHKPFSFGFVLDKLSINATDNLWNQIFVKREFDNPLYKLL